MYFDVSVESLAQVYCLKSVDGLFMVVWEFEDYQFKETEEVLKDFEESARNSHAQTLKKYGKLMPVSRKKLQKDKSEFK